VDFFKRSDNANANAPLEPAVRAGERRRFARPLPLPEVIEGNEDSDWALWEKSVSFQDSQMPSATMPLESPQVKEPTPPQDEPAADAFASVHRRSR